MHTSLVQQTENISRKSYYILRVINEDQALMLIHRCAWGCTYLKGDSHLRNTGLPYLLGICVIIFLVFIFLHLDCSCIDSHLASQWKSHHDSATITFSNADKISSRFSAFTTRKSNSEMGWWMQPDLVGQDTQTGAWLVAMTATKSPPFLAIQEFNFHPHSQPSARSALVVACHRLQS
jgi:hypothetical protein